MKWYEFEQLHAHLHRKDLIPLYDKGINISVGNYQFDRIDYSPFTHNMLKHFFNAYEYFDEDNIPVEELPIERKKGLCKSGT